MRTGYLLDTYQFDKLASFIELVVLPSDSQRYTRLKAAIGEMSGYVLVSMLYRLNHDNVTQDGKMPLDEHVPREYTPQLITTGHHGTVCDAYEIVQTLLDQCSAEYGTVGYLNMLVTLRDYLAVEVANHYLNLRNGS
jgi:hypothetical protein